MRERNLQHFGLLGNTFSLFTLMEKKEVESLVANKVCAFERFIESAMGEGNGGNS